MFPGYEVTHHKFRSLLNHFCCLLYLLACYYCSTKVTESRRGIRRYSGTPAVSILKNKKKHLKKRDADSLPRNVILKYRKVQAQKKQIHERSFQCNTQCKTRNRIVRQTRTVNSISLRDPKFRKHQYYHLASEHL